MSRSDERVDRPEPGSPTVPLLILAALTAMLGVRLYQNFPHLHDLDILYTAAERFFAGEPIFRQTDVFEHTKPPLASYLLGVLLLFPSREILFVVWHGINLLLPVAWLVSVRGRLDLPVAAAMFFGFNFWFTETTLGQYNLVLGVVVWFAFHRERAWVSGALFSFVLLLKPSFFVFLPWLLYRRTARDRVLFLVGAGGVPAVLGLIYVLDRGAQVFVSDHLAWLSFLGFSEAKHIERIDNLAIPSLLLRSFGLHLHAGAWLLAGTAFNAIGLHRLRGRSPVVTYSLCALGFLAFSPMTWRQNFIVLLPFLAWTAGELEQRWRDHKLALLFLATPFCITPVGIPEPLSRWVFASALPLWGMIALFATMLRIVRSADNSR